MAVIVGRERLDWCEVVCLVLVGELAGVGKCVAMRFCLGLLFAAHDTFGGPVAVCRLFFAGVVSATHLHLLFLSVCDGVAGYPRRSYLFLGGEAAPHHSAFSFAQVVSALFAFRVPVVAFSAALVCWRA